ncbi:hypothetical protein BDF19DRAFT_435296 [Syncephalis fuscata]|nr:hypothetical protein BDF19DRAFT_435296 [Syncephalis fuscata]
MHLINFLAISMLACTTSAFILPNPRLICPMMVTKCSCKSDSLCVRNTALFSCNTVMCVPLKPNKGCQAPKCASKCKSTQQCLYVGATSKDCGKPTCVEPSETLM